MASDTRTESGDARRSRLVLSRLGIRHRHSVGTTLLVVVLALVCGLYAGWLVADFGLRWPALVVVAVLGGVFFYARSSSTGVLTAGLYTIAFFLAVTPVVLDLAFVVDAGSYGVGTPWPFVLSLVDLVFLVIFVVLALVVAGIGFLVGRRAKRKARSGDTPT